MKPIDIQFVVILDRSFTVLGRAAEEVGAIFEGFATIRANPIELPVTQAIAGASSRRTVKLQILETDTVGAIPDSRQEATPDLLFFSLLCSGGGAART